MKKLLSVADLRKRMNAWHREEITFSRATELLNEDVNKALRSINFEEKIQSELNKLNHVDEDQHNDEQISGFEQGARFILGLLGIDSEHEDFIDYAGYRYWYEYRLAKDGLDLCLATEDPKKYCNGLYLYSAKDTGNGKAFVIVETDNPRFSRLLHITIK